MKIHNILQTDNIIKILPDATISFALSKLSSAHDAAFVFSTDEKYLGVINPYYCIIKTSSPANAKVTHCIFHAPHVIQNYSISKIVQLMIESKIHYLPVFDLDQKFIGIVSARSLLRGLKYSDSFTIKIKDILQAKKRSLITIFENDLVSHALNIFKMYRVSKLIVINKEMKLKGILSYYDLISYLATPKTREERGERIGNRSNINNKQVNKFYKSFVLTLSEEDFARDALHLIIEKKIGSVVIVDQNKHPIGIITTRDLLQLLVRNKNKERLEIISKNLSQENRRTLGGFFKQFTLWTQKKSDIKKARLIVKEEKQGNLFQVILSLFFKKGPPKVIKEEGRSLEKILKKIRES